MHPVVQIDEIFLNILSWITPISLLDMGLTCRAFYEPAMDARWFRLDSFVHLIKCLPSDAITATHDGFLDQEYTLHVTRKLIPADWLRFEAHARRVREYIMRDNTQNMGLSAPTVSVIAQHFGDRPVLPHLQRFENESIAWIDDVKLLFRCPIRAVRLNYRPIPEALGEDLALGLELVRRIDTVESLSIGGRLPIARQLSLLATMPNLGYLSIMVDDQRGSTSWIGDLATLPANSFPKLCTLQLSSVAMEWYRDVRQTVSTLETFLRTVRSHMPFSRLIVKLHKSQSHTEIYADELRKLCSYIARDYPTLESLEIITPSMFVTPSAITPLQTLHNLRTLRLRWLMIDPGLGTIQDFASSWPQLMELQWGPRYESSQGASMTIATLRTILDSFPRLEVLGIQLDVTSPLARGVFKELPLDKVVTQHRSLKTLSLGKSYVPEDAIDPLAQALARMVPTVRVALLHVPSPSKGECVTEADILPKIVLRMRELARA